jgi:GNAT superfamily N-acetyltransferase
VTVVRPPRPDELEALRSIERNAGRAFAAIGMEAIAVDEPRTAAALEAFREAGHAWVAVDDTDSPIAYLLSAIVDDRAHIEQVSVAPDHSRRGIGALLIEHLATAARAEGRGSLTLTAFRDVPWNAPYYQRLGFVIVEPPDQRPQLAALVARERSSIPGHASRVAMRRNLTP